MEQTICYRKTAHPSISGGYQGWEETIVADTLNVFDNTESRTAILVVYVEDDNPKRSGGGK